MVGVPGKSQGCKTCKKRKIKCDEQRPACRNCTTKGRSCGGYARELTFVNRFSAPTGYESPISPVWQVVSANPTSTSPSIHRHQLFEEPIAHSYSINNAPVSRYQFLSHFLKSYMPLGESGTGGLTPAVSWMQQLPEIVGDHLVMDTAVTALASGYLGVTKKDVVLIEESRALYTSAVKKLFEATSSKPLKIDVGILIAVQALGLFELFVNAGRFGWTSHTAGGAWLLQQRGPEGMSIDLLRRFRLVAVCDAIGRRRASYFSEPKWRYTPNTYDADNSDDVRDELLDIMIDIPTILERADHLSLTTSISTSSSSLRVAVATTLTQCSAIENTLQKWFARLPKRLGVRTCFWETLGPRRLKNGIENAFPGVLHFTDLKTAQLHQLYWAALVTLYGAMHMLLQLRDIQVGNEECGVRAQQQQQQQQEQEAHLMTPPSSHSPPAQEFSIPALLDNNSTTAFPPSTQHTPHTLVVLASASAASICKAQSYLLNPSFGALGPQSTVFPLWIAKQFYETQDGPAHTWCQLQFRRLADWGVGKAALMEHLTRQGFAEFGKTRTPGHIVTADGEVSVRRLSEG